MLRRTAKFIHRLRILFFAIILISFLFVIGLNPVDISVFLGSKLGRAVGMSVSVPENPINKLALQLKEKETELNQKEQALNKREAEMEDQLEARYSPLMLLLSIGIIVLFVLISINYYLDFRRKRSSFKEHYKNK